MSWSCYHTHNIYNLTYMIFHLIIIFDVMFVKIVPRGNVTSENIYKKTPAIFSIQIQDFNISDTFYKIQNLKKWQIKAVVPFLPRNLKLHSPCDKSKIVRKLKNTNCDHTKELKLWQNQKVKLGQNSKTLFRQKLT